MGWPNEGAVDRAVDELPLGMTLGDSPDNDVKVASAARSLTRNMLTAAGLPELVGSTDTAKIYGVESSNLSRVSGLPDPLYGPGLEPPRYVRAGNLYDADEVRAHAASRKAAA